MGQSSPGQFGRLVTHVDQWGSNNFAKLIVFLPAAIMAFFFYRYLGRYKKFLALQNTRGNWKSFSEYRLDKGGKAG
jgi:hypothetical protein